MELPPTSEVMRLLPYLTSQEAARLKALLEAEIRDQGLMIVPNPPDIVEWAEEKFYIIETKRPIVLQPVQKAVLREFFRRGDDGRFIYHTGLYSTIKKSGKTTITALMMQWAAETWGDFGEVYHMGNKLGQAKERAFKIAKRSIQLSPWSNDWDTQALALLHHPTNSVIRPLPVSAAGEAGGNQRMTAWTEVHGYVHVEDEEMYGEMQPVPTQPLSFRVLDSYAGYLGKSNLLKGVWDTALKGERIHDEYPIYAVPEIGLIAYIDTGEEARRMPWQTPKYYREMQATELPHQYARLHLNEWVTSQDTFINIGIWDALEDPLEVDDAKKLMVVLVVDASVSGDCTALSVLTYLHETSKGAGDDKVVELETIIYEPPEGGKLDYHEDLKPDMKRMFSNYRVIGVAYDEYQLHDFMTQMGKDETLFKGAFNSGGKKLTTDQREQFFYPFPQGKQRLQADTALLNRLRQDRFRHSGNADVREHVQNADAKDVGESAIRIVKREKKKHIDALVAISMGAWRISELMMNTPKSNTPMRVSHNLYGKRGRGRSRRR